MQVKFNAYGHENIRAVHDRTIEFTKHKELSINGDCIIGVNSDLSYDGLKELLSFDRLRVKIKVDDIVDEINCSVNKDFCDKEEIVFRISNFGSDRTLGIRCDKACSDINRRIVEKMKEKGKKMEVIIEGIK